MCNRYSSKIPYPDYVERFREIKIPLVFPPPSAAPNLEPLDNIAPTDTAPVIRPVDGGVELRPLRWGLIPWFHKGGIKEWKMLTTNARFETLATTRTFKSAFECRRCLVPVTTFFEWTGEKGHKVKWSFARTDGAWLCFAGLWDRAETADGIVDSYALVTTAAGPDVAPYHDRQPIMLEQGQYGAWMNDATVPDSALRPSQGLLAATQA